MDTFGRGEQFDSQAKNTRINYRYTVGPDYQNEFFRALNKGKGFNVMETLATTMRAKELYKFAKELLILQTF